MCALVFLYVLLAAALVYGSPLAPSRIMGGQLVSIEQFGFMASLGTVLPSGQHHHVCGASILTSNCILTAAQCVGQSQSQPLRRVRVGSSFFAFGGLLVDVSRYFVHPSFKGGALEHDVALLQLASHLSGAATTAVYILAQGSAVPAGLSATVLGWGYLHPNMPVLSDNLRAVDVMTVDWNTCRDRYASQFSTPAVTTNMICAGMLDVGGSSFCSGDEGGPLIIGDIQVGIASWSYVCGHQFYPGVYTNLTNYTNWIIATVTYYFY